MNELQTCKTDEREMDSQVCWWGWLTRGLCNMEQIIKLSPGPPRSNRHQQYCCVTFIYEHTLCRRLLVCGRPACANSSTCCSSFAQALLPQVLLPRTSLLFTFVWGNAKHQGYIDYSNDSLTVLRGSKSPIAPLFFFSRSLRAARISRLSSKSAALSSWRGKHTGAVTHTKMAKWSCIITHC